MDSARSLSLLSGSRVLVTGHTGFKGSWLCEWLLSLGAEVSGIALDPPTSPSLFDQLDLANRISSDRRIDIRDAEAVERAVRDIRPDFVFHLAAQPLVRRSYAEPALTWETNVFGTIRLLEALRTLDHPCSVVVATTDKVYENREWLYGYRECDSLGGHDPYSSSKAAAEIAVASWRSSFFLTDLDAPIRIATARAGNVIGGGDWAEDRIVPDAIRALEKGHPIEVRNPGSTRPWQHVLEPLGGYLSLAAQLAKGNPRAMDAFNFGPWDESNRTVAELVEEILRSWPGEWRDASQADHVHEASLLHLATDKARTVLDWRPSWGFRRTLSETVNWYREANLEKADPVALTRRQIGDFAASLTQI